MAKNISSQLGEHLVPAILQRLSRMAVLPDKGILAGQAVASAIMEELGLGPVVYNDIDVFISTGGDEQLERRLTNPEFRVAEANKLSIPLLELDDYENMLILDDAVLMSIVGTEKEGKLNTIWCKPNDLWCKPSSHTQLEVAWVIQTFDLNCVEVGIDLQTKEILWSAAFEYFLNTREIQVTTISGSPRTLLRFFKKLDELQAYGNKSLVCHLAAYAQKEERSKALLSRKFYELAKRYQPEFSEIFDIIEESPDAQGIVSRSLAVKETWVLPKVFEAATKRKDGLLQLEAESIAAAPLIFYRAVEKASGYEKAFYDTVCPAYETEADPEDMKESTSSMARISEVFLHLYGMSYLKGDPREKFLKVVNKAVAEHHELYQALTGLSLSQQYDCVRDLKSRAKKCGKYVYGLMRAAFPIDMCSARNRDLFFKRMERDSARELSTPLFGNVSIEGGWVIQELLTTKALREEGERLNHCVGGYSSLVESGSTRILSVRNVHNAKDASTVEVTVNEKSKKLYIAQNRSYSNREPTEENRAIVSRYLTEVAERLGYSIRYRADAWFDDWLDDPVDDEVAAF